MCRFIIFLGIAAVCSQLTTCRATVAASSFHAEHPKPDIAAASASFAGNVGSNSNITDQSRLLRKERNGKHEVSAKNKNKEHNGKGQVGAAPGKRGKEPTPTEAEWEHYKGDLFICRHFQNICSPGLITRLRYALIAGAKMHNDVWFMGGEWLSFLGFVCLVAGIFISRKVDDNEQTDPALKCAAKDECIPVVFREENGMDSTSRDNVDGHGGKDSFEKHLLGSDVANKNMKDRMADWWVHNISRNRTSWHMVGPDEEQHTRNGYDEDEMTSLAPIKDETPTMPTTSSECASENAMRYWTDTTLTFTEPLLTFKIFLAALIFIELNDIMAPEQSMLATPEVVGILRELPNHKDGVPAYADWLLPGLNDSNADSWIAFLQLARAMLLCSWFSFLLLPKKHAVIGGAFYGFGAVLYVYLGAIGLMYDLAHSTQGGMLFILAAVPAVPFLESNRRANHWLRKFLYIGILVPIYLFSGVSKIRYEGIVANITGSWLWPVFIPKKAYRSVIPTVFVYIHEHHWATCLMSWGNIVTELVLPPSVMIFTENIFLRLVFHFSEILFHFTIFVLLGPNFTRYCLMHILALNPLGCIPCFATIRPGSPASPATRGDWARVGFAIFIMFAWFSVQVKSDIFHLTGKSDSHQRINPYFPIPELSMFAKPSDTPNFGMAFGMVLVSFLTLLISMVR